ncbi:hypothetical protein D9M70_632010 [compost metagenome]
MPFALAAEQALVELAAIPGAVVVVQAAFALQTAVDQLATVTRTIRQAGVRRGQRFAFATGSQQGDEEQREETMRHGRRRQRTDEASV